MDFNTFKHIVIQKCAEKGITEYELYYQAAESTSIAAFQHEINQFTSSIEGGVCFRCIVDGKMGYASTQALNEDEAKAIVAKAADNARVLETEEQVFLCEGGKEYEKLDVTLYDLPSVENLVSKALETQEKIYAADSAVIDGCQTQVISEHSEIAIYNSKGLDLHWENNASGVMVLAMVTDGKEMSNSYEMKLGELSKLDTDKMVSKAVEDAKRKLGGEPPVTGVYPVIFDPEAMSSLMGVFSSVFSSENAQKGLSRLGSSEGEIIAAPIVTLVDDPFHAENPMPMNFDAEGSPTHKKNIQLSTSFERYARVLEQLNMPIRLNFTSIYNQGKGNIENLSHLTGTKADSKWIGIAPFATHEGKIYPLEKMTKVIGALSSAPHVKIFLFGGGKKETEILSEWEKQYPSTVCIAGKLKWDTELALMSHLDVMLSMDSSNMHLASLVGTPVVSIWGATHPHAGFMGWKQSTDNSIQTDLPCRPCSIFGNKPCLRQDYACLQEITPDQIVNKLKTFIYV